MRTGAHLAAGFKIRQLVEYLEDYYDVQTENECIEIIEQEVKRLKEIREYERNLQTNR